MARSRAWFVLMALLPIARAGVASGYHLDPGNTQITFAITRFGLHWLTAGFSDLSGEFALDRSGQGGTLSVDVRMDSIDCRDAYWNQHLRSPDWLDTRQFPEMSYRSNRIEMSRGGQAKVFGNLTLLSLIHI